MTTSTLTPSTQRRVAWVTPPDEAALPARVRAYFGRLRERFGFVRNSAWALSLQPEHLLAYATWSEALFDPDNGSLSQ